MSNMSTDDVHPSISKPHLLIYAHYYGGLASTGNILQELAEGLLPQFNVTVICVVPSYLGTVTEEYKAQKYYFENINGVNVIRVRVPEFSKADKISRVKNIVTYFIRAMQATRKVRNTDGSKTADYVLSVSQPPILGGLLGVYGKFTLKPSIKKKIKFIYQIQDFNPEQVKAIQYCENRFIIGTMMMLDKFSCRNSDLVITVGHDLVDTLKNRFRKHPKKAPKVTLINNWVDEKEIFPLPADHPKVLAFRGRYNLTDKFVIGYSGNIGLYYDLLKLIRVMKQFRKGYTQSGVYEPGMRTKPSAKYPEGREVVFAFIGAGSLLSELKTYTKQHHFENIVFIPYQEKKDLIYSLNAIDVHWCVNAKGIKGVSVPSKAYGIMAAGKPILGVLEKDSEIRMLIEESHCGICCEPGDYSVIADQIRWFIENADGGGNSNDVELDEMGKRGRRQIEEEINKDNCIKKYAEAILNS